MATAEAMFIPPLSMQSPYVALHLVEAAPVVLSQSPQEEPTVTKRKRSGPMLVSQAPVQAKVASSDGDYLAQLAQYMSAVLVLSTNVAKNQSQLSALQTQESQAFVELSKQEADEAAKAIAAHAAAVAAAAHKSWIQKIVTTVVGSVMTLIGALTLQPELVLAGLFLLTMNSIPMNGNGDTAMTILNSKLASSGSSLRIVEDIGIAIGMAVVMCGIGGSLTALLEGSEEGAAVAAGGEVEAGAGAADAANEGAAVQNEAAVIENEESSFFSKAFKAGFKNGKFRSQLAQMTMVVNPFTDSMRALLNVIAPKMSDSDKDKYAGYFGMSMCILVNLGSFAKDCYDSYKTAQAAGKITPEMGRLEQLKLAAGNSEALQNFSAKLEKALGENYKYYKGLTLFLKTGNAALMSAANVLGIQAGQQMLIAAARLKDMGAVQADQGIYDSVLAMVTANVQESQGAADAVNKNIAMMNQRWDAYAAPYMTGAEVMG